MRAADIELLLPEVLRRTVVPDSPMSALVGVMEAMHAPAEDALRGFPTVLDPLATPDRFVTMLAGWVDLARLDATPAGRIDAARMRLLVSLSAELSDWRGTPGGLMWLLTLATGVQGLHLDTTGPFAVRIVVPQESAAQADLVREIAAQEKPAHLVVEVVVATAAPAAPMTSPSSGASASGSARGVASSASSGTSASGPSGSAASSSSTAPSSTPAGGGTT
ncbi:MAG TPA: phage tail protein [Propionibacteriaceae bacterium]|nr:phage tail protein [Propionibacteriaceae bacterium]